MENPFAKFFDLRKLGLLKKDNSVFALDIGSSSVKVIQLRNDKGRVVLETYGEIATGPYNNLAVGQVAALPLEKQVELLTDLFKEANVTAKRGALSIPLRSSLLVTTEMPDMPKADMQKAVPLEARKYIPIAISEVELDWWVIPKKAGDNVNSTESPAKAGRKMAEVLLVAIHKDTLQRYQEVATNIKVSPEFFEIETFSAIRSSLHNDISATAMVDLGASTTKVAIVDYGIVRLSHTINKGAQDITVAVSRSLGVSFAKAEEIKRRVGLIERAGEEGVVHSISPVVEYIFSELNRVMINYQKKYGRSIDKVVMIGGGALLKGVLEVAEKSIDTKVVIGTPFDKVEAPAFLNNVLKEAGPGFAVSIGIALRAMQE
jgi:type IV pilus assembly protein PilM